MTTIERLLEIAKEELGVAEVPGSHNNPRIIEYDATTTLKATSDEVPWCSAFVNWCVIKAGLEGTNSAAARSWLDWGKRIDFKDAKPGHIIVVKRHGKNIQKWQAHVGFVHDLTNFSVNILGGNQDNKVCNKVFSRLEILGIRAPNA